MEMQLLRIKITTTVISGRRQPLLSSPGCRVGDMGKLVNNAGEGGKRERGKEMCSPSGWRRVFRRCWLST